MPSRKRPRRSPGDAAALAARVLRGDQRAVSRALSLVTDETEGYEAVTRAFFSHEGRSHKIGLCGSPGSGKSSLANRLVGLFRKAGQTVGVLAVDPSSPFTGGAFLGDRLRVQEHALDEGVFMRSLATRGMMGGLSETIFGAIHVLETYGFDRILIETVGTGQDEVDVADVVDTVVCVTAPYQGDEFQAMKAGLTEIADIFVVNKMDVDDAWKTVSSLKDAMSLVPASDAGWTVPIEAVSALSGQGLGELIVSLDKHRARLSESGEGLARKRRQLRKELSLLLSRRIYKNTLARITEGHIDTLMKRRSDPLTLGKKILKAGGRRKAAAR